MHGKLQRIVVGRISGIYGVRGYLRVISYTRPLKNIFNYEKWWIRQGEDWQDVTLLDSQVLGKGFIAKIQGIDDRDHAREFIDADIAIEQTQLAEVEPGEYYWHDLIGLSVCNQNGKDLGQVRELLETGANDVLVVEGEQRILIPYIKEHYILAIDLDKKMIRVDWDPEMNE